MPKITDPFNINSMLTKNEVVLPWFGLVNCLAICLLLSILSSSAFISYPGVAIDLPSMSAEHLPNNLLDHPSVLAVHSEQSLFFDNKPIHLDKLQEHLQNKARGVAAGDSALLIKADKGASLNTLLSILEQAQESGFSRIYIAGMPQHLDFKKQSVPGGGQPLRKSKQKRTHILNAQELEQQVP